MTNSELAQPGVSQSVAEYAAAQGPPVEALAGITVAALELESCGS